MYKLIGSLMLAACIITPVASQQARERLSPECRKQVRDLCFSGGVRDREAIRACFKEKASQLSEDCRAELRKRIEGRMGRERQAPSEGGKDIGYGPDQRQRLDYWPASRKASPLVVYIHGGGWSRGDKRQGAGSKPTFYNQLGYSFASLNYRLVPQVSPDSQAQDIAVAIATLRKDAGQLGFDPSRIILMGHSAGAHLAALVATDPRYLQTAAVPMNAIVATVLLDGAGYDVPRQMADAKNRVGPLYEAAFTTDKARQAALSPVTHAAAPNSRNWLILHVAARADAKAQSDALATALRRAGAQVEVKAVPDATHMTVNRDAGQEGTFVAREISGFLNAL